MKNVLTLGQMLAVHARLFPNGWARATSNAA